MWQPDHATSVSNLAGLLWAMGRFDDAAEVEA